MTIPQSLLCFREGFEGLRSITTEYTFIKCKRKSIGITVKPDGSVVVRAPLYCTKRRAEQFLTEKMDWVERMQEKMAARREAGKAAGLGGDTFTEAEIRACKKKARLIIVPLVEETAALMGVHYGTIAIRAQKTRWGSCSSKGNLNFNCLLVYMPDNVIRYVVVHELCHLREMNHSAAFWKQVERYCPTYKEDRKELKRLGSGLMERLG